MNILNVITACSRPENLPLLEESLEPGKASFELRWLVIHDTGEVESRVGNAQKNEALEMIDSGWVYFLDDDNLIHPKFFPAIAQAIHDGPGRRGFIFSQDCNLFIRRASPETVRVDRIDLAQFVLRRDLIGSWRFDLPTYNSDGMLIEGLYQKHAGEFTFIDQVLCYYNRLRWPESVIVQ